MDPVFHIEDAAEAQPLARGGDITNHWVESLPVFCPSDGRTRTATADPESFKGTIVSAERVDDTTFFPIPPIRNSLCRLYGIDKCVYFQWFRGITTIKASRWSAPPYTSSTTTFQSADTLFAYKSHIDSFSGLIVIVDKDDRRRVLIDFLSHS